MLNKAAIDGAYHLDLERQMAAVKRFARDLEGMPEILAVLAQVEDAWVGSGFLFQNIWNALHGFAEGSHIKDIDIVYFDASDLSEAGELAMKARLLPQLPDLGPSYDIVNVARIHTWYEKAYGIELQPYQSVAQSIASWPSLAGCLVLREVAGDLRFIAPYGFEDCLRQRIRPNPILVNAQIYRAKAEKWKRQWPGLEIITW